MSILVTALAESTVVEFSDSARIQKGELANHGMLGTVKVLNIHDTVAEVVDRHGKHIRVQLSSLRPGEATEESVNENYDKHSTAASQYDHDIENGATDRATYKDAAKHHERASKTAPTDALRKIHAKKADEYLTKSKSANESISEGAIKDVENELAKHGQYKVDYEKKNGPMNGTDLHQHETIRKQLLSKKRKAQAAYDKKMNEAVVSELSAASYQGVVDREAAKKVGHLSDAGKQLRTIRMAKEKIAQKNTEHDLAVKGDPRVKTEQAVDELAMPYTEFSSLSLWNNIAKKANFEVEQSHAGRKLRAYNKHGDFVGEFDTEANKGFMAGSSVNEAHKLGDRVSITKGPKDVVGKSGRIGEIRHGAFKGAEKTYTVDHDNGSVQLKSSQFKRHKEVSEALDVAVLQAGDPIRIIGGVEGQGETGTFVDHGMDGKFVIVQMADGSKRSYHSSDIEYCEDDEDDEDMDECMNESKTVLGEALKQISEWGIGADRHAEYDWAPAPARSMASNRNGKYCLTRDNPPIRGRGFLCFESEKDAVFAWKKLSNNTGVKIVRESAFHDDGTPLKEGEVLLVDPLTEATEKKSAPAPRNFVAKNAKMGGAGAHKDAKRAAKQGEVKHKGKLEEAEDGYAKVEKAIAQHKRTLKNKLATPANVAYAQKMIARGNAALKKDTGEEAYKHFQGAVSESVTNDLLALSEKL